MRIRHKSGSPDPPSSLRAPPVPREHRHIFANRIVVPNEQRVARPHTSDPAEPRPRKQTEKTVARADSEASIQHHMRHQLAVLAERHIRPDRRPWPHTCNSPAPARPPQRSPSDECSRPRSLDRNSSGHRLGRNHLNRLRLLLAPARSQRAHHHASQAICPSTVATPRIFTALVRQFSTVTSILTGPPAPPAAGTSPNRCS